MNKCFLIGNLTKDVSLIDTQSGKVARFTLAVNRYAGNGERKADYFPVIAWNSLGERCAKYLGKGKKAAVVGVLQNREYTANDGTKRTNTEIIATDVEFLSARGEDASTAPPNQPVNPEQMGMTEIKDDLPF